MTMSHPAEVRLQHDPGDPEQSREPAPDPGWLERRIPAVFATVMLTLALIVVWKVIRHVMW
jgi:hypothetical protein